MGSITITLRRPILWETRPGSTGPYEIIKRHDYEIVAGQKRSESRPCGHVHKDRFSVEKCARRESLGSALNGKDWIEIRDCAAAKHLRCDHCGRTCRAPCVHSWQAHGANPDGEHECHTPECRGRLRLHQGDFKTAGRCSSCGYVISVGIEGTAPLLRIVSGCFCPDRSERIEDSGLRHRDGAEEALRRTVRRLKRRKVVEPAPWPPRAPRYT